MCGGRWRAARFAAVFLGLAILSGYSAQAQSTWSWTYGGPLADRMYQIVATPDAGNVVLSSFVTSSGDWDGRYVRVGPTGVVLAAGSIGGQGDDFLYRIAPSSDGGYFLAGTTESYGAGGIDVWIIKLDSEGELLWQKAYGQAGDQELEAMAATSDGGAVIAADVYLPGQREDFWVFKVDGSGNVVWSKTIGGTDTDSPRGIFALPGTGGYAVTGSTYTYGKGYQGWIVTFLETGEVSYQNTIESAGGPVLGKDLAQASDGNFLFLGSAYEPAGTGNQVMVAKLTPEGTFLWQESIGGTATDEGYRIIPTQDGGCFVAGRTASFPGGVNTTDAWAARLDSSGAVLWERRFGELYYDHFEDALPTSDGGLMLAGTKASDGPDQGQGWLVKVDASDGSTDGSCGFVNATSFGATALAAVLGASSYPVSNYAPEVTATTAYGTLETVDSALLCSSPLVCTLDGTASAPDRISAGLPAAFQATATAPDCPDLPAFAWSFGDGGTSALPNPTHTYATGGSFTWSVLISVSEHSLTRSGVITVSNPPVVSALKKVAPPFTIAVTGGNFQNGIRVFIDGMEWTNVTFKKATKIKLGGGSLLKAAVPKGVSKTFRFLNPDGGETSTTWSW